jgi:hypothetical protein
MAHAGRVRGSRTTGRGVQYSRSHAERAGPAHHEFPSPAYARAPAECAVGQPSMPPWTRAAFAGVNQVCRTIA